MRKRLFVARKWPRSSSAADVSVKANPSSMTEATSDGFSPDAIASSPSRGRRQSWSIRR
jgi:hypothetical protein